MPERTSHPPGAFSWAELTTSDTDAAKAFYTEIFAWGYDDMPVGDDQVYSMARLEGKHVAALYASDQPPHWNNYVTVASVDETAARVAGLDGTVLAEPFDVMDAGRSAVVADPAGGALFLWEPRESIGAELVNQPGAMAWNDLVTTDPEGAERFYGELLGWSFQEIPDAGGYRVIRNGERSNGGILPREGGPVAWLPYFGHPDVGSLVEQVGGLGGQVMNGPMPVPAGTFAVFTDPQGAVFAALTSSAYDD
jgi:uncharacterized protein